MTGQKIENLSTSENWRKRGIKYLGLCHSGEWRMGWEKSFEWILKIISGSIRSIFEVSNEWKCKDILMRGVVIVNVDVIFSAAS